jgi:hypothetical protein
MLTLEQFKALTPVQQFEENLKNSLCMGDKKQSVKELADKIGAIEANKIAFEHGLKSSYYMA